MSWGLNTLLPLPPAPSGDRRPVRRAATVGIAYQAFDFRLDHIRSTSFLAIRLSFVDQAQIRGGRTEQRFHLPVFRISRGDVLRHDSGTLQRTRNGIGCSEVGRVPQGSSLFSPVP